MLQQQLDERRVAGTRRAQQRRRTLREDRVAATILRHVTVWWTTLQLEIGIGAFLQQKACDVERSDRILAGKHRHRAIAFGRQRAGVSGHIDRRAAEEVPLIDISAGVDHERRKLVVQVEQRHVERRDAFGVFEILVGAGSDQMARALDAAFARRVEERGEAALVHVLGTRLGDDLALPLTNHAARVQIGTVGGEELDHLGLALRSRPHQRCLSAEVLFGVDIGTGFEQPLRRIDLAGSRDRHQRRFTLGVPGIGIRPSLQQRIDDRRRADDRRFGDRGGAELVGELHIRAGLDQRAHQLEIIVRRGVHDGGRAVGAWRVRIRAFRQ